MIMSSEVRVEPWHAGELLLQERAGVDAETRGHFTRFVRGSLSEQHRAFFPRLPFVIVGSVDPRGDPWVTVLEGPPGFAQSPDSGHLDLHPLLAADDPASIGLAAGEAVGLLGIQLETRRRNRVNGRVLIRQDNGLRIAVAQAYGNCPQYIHTHELEFSRDPRVAVPTVSEHFDGLDAEAQAWITHADSCFVTSYADEGARTVDVSHRGGRPGFIDVDGDTLTFPDFFGNRFFNTLGNMLVNPRAGVLFIDFATGDVLQLTGRTEVFLDGPEVEAFDGAEQVWRLHVQHMVRRRGALALRGTMRDFSMEAERTSTWEESRLRR
ncbi:MAG: pyridoxamine 5-phosphate oxidase [Pseudomonas sp.]|nr:pyridoxamine 5-phosphate oxidase [Pseudomonas sp.]